MRAVSLSRFGGPDVLMWGPVPDPVCGPDDAVVRVEACGVNHCDLDIRGGTSRWDLELPMVLGGEVAGVVADVGSRVEGFRDGDAVAVLQHFDGPHGDRIQLGIDCWGGYAEYVAVPARALVPLASASQVDAAAGGQTMMSTAWRMVCTLGQVNADETVLVPSASGGVGTGLIAVAKLRGARVIATVGSPDKLAAVRGLGADVVICYSSEPVAETVLEHTDQQGVDCVLDTVGGPTLAANLAALRVDGRYVICGAHAGESAVLDLVRFFQHGHRLLGLGFCTEKELRVSLAHVLDGHLPVRIAARYPISRAADAHRAVERREHVGKLLLEAVER